MMLMNQHLCRCCLLENPTRTHNLFEGDGSVRLELLQCVPSVSMAPDDGLPDIICDPCYMRVREASDFRRRCEENDRELRKRYENTNHVIEEALKLGIFDDIDEEVDGIIENLALTEKATKETDSLGYAKELSELESLDISMINELISEDYSLSCLPELNQSISTREENPAIGELLNKAINDASFLADSSLPPSPNIAYPTISSNDSSYNNTPPLADRLCIGQDNQIVCPTIPLNDSSHNNTPPLVGSSYINQENQITCPAIPLNDSSHNNTPPLVENQVACPAILLNDSSYNNTPPSIIENQILQTNAKQLTKPNKSNKYTKPIKSLKLAASSHKSLHVDSPYINQENQIARFPAIPLNDSSYNNTPPLVENQIACPAITLNDSSHNNTASPRDSPYINQENQIDRFPAIPLNDSSYNNTPPLVENQITCPAIPLNDSSYNNTPALVENEIACPAIPLNDSSYNNTPTLADSSCIDQENQILQTNAKQLTKPKKSNKSTKPNKCLKLAASSHKSLHPCTECEKKFTRNFQLKLHMISVHKLGDGLQYDCTECQKTFASRHSLNYHIKSLHSTLRPFACPQCSRTFVLKTQLASHERIHSGESKPRIHECMECGKSWPTKSDLRTHMRSHDPDVERPFKCDRCAKSFFSRGHLISHLLVHTGEKPFACTFCEKSYQSVGNLNNHLVRHHAHELVGKDQQLLLDNMEM